MLLKNRAPRIESLSTQTSKAYRHLDEKAVAVLRWLIANRIDFVLVGDVARAIRGDRNAPGPVAITIDGKNVEFSPAAVERGGRVFVPLRGVFQYLGASVVYDAGTINATMIDRTVSLKLGSSDATVNGVPQQLDAPPFLIGQDTYVPLRFVSQALGATVQYDGQRRQVAIVTLGAQAQSAAAAGSQSPAPSETQKANFVQLTAPTDGQTVTPIFLVAGRTAVQARVHITAGNFSGDTVADSTGYFSLQVTLTPGGSGSSVPIHVASVDPISKTTASADLSVKLQ